MLRLFDSLMRNYPIQTFLFWRTKDEIKARKFMEQVEWDPDLTDFYEPNMSKAGVKKVFDPWSAASSDAICYFSLRNFSENNIGKRHSLALPAET